MRKYVYTVQFVLLYAPISAPFYALAWAIALAVLIVHEVRLRRSVRRGVVMLSIDCLMAFWMVLNKPSVNSGLYLQN